MRHVTFIRDPESADRPSNVLMIDPGARTIDTRGDDHRIEDAHGHVFTFPAGPALKPGLTEPVIVGEAPPDAKHV